MLHGMESWESIRQRLLRQAEGKKTSGPVGGKYKSVANGGKLVAPCSTLYSASSL